MQGGEYLQTIELAIYKIVTRVGRWLLTDKVSADNGKMTEAGRLVSPDASSSCYRDMCVVMSRQQYPVTDKGRWLCPGEIIIR